MQKMRTLLRLNRLAIVPLVCCLFPQMPAVAQQLPTLSPAPGAEFSTGAIAASDYILGAGDQIAITVYGYEEFTGSRAILPDGTIALPLIGSVRASGKTVDSLAQDITAQLRPYLTNPVVDVSLSVLRPIVVNVAGEVHRPGPIQLSSLTDVNTRVATDSRITSTSTTPTLASALTAAGGVKRTADIQRVILQRPLGGNRYSTATINLWDALSSEVAPDDIILRDGDSIFIPQISTASAIDPRLVARSSYAPETVRVRVVGEVKEPGELEVLPDSTISGAISAAGGPTLDAELDSVALVRLNDQGQVEEQILDLENLVDGYQVLEGDVIYVPKQEIRETIDFADRLFGPLGFIVDVFDFLF